MCRKSSFMQMRISFIIQSTKHLLVCYTQNLQHEAVNIFGENFAIYLAGYKFKTNVTLVINCFKC